MPKALRGLALNPFAKKNAERTSRLLPHGLFAGGRACSWSRPTALHEVRRWEAAAPGGWPQAFGLPLTSISCNRTCGLWKRLSFRNEAT